VPKFEKYSEEVYVSACENLGVDPELLRQELDDIKVQDLFTSIGTRPLEEAFSEDERILHAELGIFCHLVDDIADVPKADYHNLMLRVGDLITSLPLSDPQNIPIVTGMVMDLFSREWTYRSSSSKTLLEVYDSYIKRLKSYGEVNEFAFNYSLLKMIVSGFVQNSAMVSLHDSRISPACSQGFSPPPFFSQQYRYLLKSGLRYAIQNSSSEDAVSGNLYKSLLEIPDAVLISNASGIQNMFYPMFNPNMERGDFAVIEMFDALMGPMAYFMNALKESKYVNMPDGISIKDTFEINSGFSKYFSTIRDLIRHLFKVSPPSQRVYLTKVKQFELGFKYVFAKSPDTPLSFGNFLSLENLLAGRWYSLPAEYMRMLVFFHLR